MTILFLPARPGDSDRMHPVIYFDHISIETPLARIYRRLGYREGMTRTSVAQEAEVEAYIAEALALIRLQGAALRLPVVEGDGTGVVLGAENRRVALPSRRLARFLDRCGEVLLMGVTAGSLIMDAIREDVGGNRAVRGVVLDATASETADAALDWIAAYFRQALRREQKTLTEKRFSAGYGDFLLENQRVLVELLGLGRLGVEVTATCILVPEKSVTALAGIQEM